MKYYRKHNAKNAAILDAFRTLTPLPKEKKLISVHQVVTLLLVGLLNY
jgi:hypothetical protein|tara:strand:+ start:1344 stop:1487 length:144 start_codon:yes stop_codon:yes gene_type:complete